MPDKTVKKRQDRRTRVFLWSEVFLLAGLTLFALLESPSINPHVNLMLAWIAGIIVMSAVVGAYVLAYQHGLMKLREDIVFLIDAREIMRLRPGWPDVRIALQEVHRLRETRKWLIVESGQPYTRIAIPTDVEAYVSLKDELMKHCPGASRQH